VQPQRIDKMVELLGQAADRQLATFDVFALVLRTGVPPEPGERAENELQRLPHVMSSHCEQHGIELTRTLQVVFAARHDADLSAFNHDAPLP
jgi:hypothetical protein